MLVLYGGLSTWCIYVVSGTLQENVFGNHWLRSTREILNGVGTLTDELGQVVQIKSQQLTETKV